MITRVEASNYRCLRSVGVTLSPFQILVGPNGSGKSAFMDVLAFIRDLATWTVTRAVKVRTDNFHDLVYGRDESRFTLAIEAELPEAKVIEGEPDSYTRLRYEVSVRLDVASESPLVEGEKVILFDPRHAKTWPLADREHTKVELKYGDASRRGFVGDIPPFDSVIGFFPTGPKEFPTLRWFADLIREGIRSVRLTTRDLHEPSTAQREKASTLTGANLARLVFELREKSPDSFKAWVRHLQTALPDLDTVRTVLLEQQKARYLELQYQNGLPIPARVVSDGTLCLLALTILAYLPNAKLVYLIEEPENAVHPTAVDTIYQSLSSLYDGQVLMASHSPILLGLAKKEQLLCFSRAAGATQIVPGKEHPGLQEWKGEVSLSDLFAGGILG